MLGCWSVLLWGEERVPDRSWASLTRCGWSGCCVGNPPSPCLNPEAFQSLSMPQTWGPELHHSCAGTLLALVLSVEQLPV